MNFIGDVGLVKEILIHCSVVEKEHEKVNKEFLVCL